jgi:hypothetical protein
MKQTKYILLLSLFLVSNPIKASDSQFVQMLYNAGPSSASQVVDIAMSSGAVPSSVDKGKLLNIVQSAINSYNSNNPNAVAGKQMYASIEQALQKSNMLTFSYGSYSQPQINNKPDGSSVEQNSIKNDDSQLNTYTNPDVSSQERAVGALTGVSLDANKIYSILQKDKLLTGKGKKERAAVIASLNDFINGLNRQDKYKKISEEQLSQVIKILKENGYV